MRDAKQRFSGRAESYVKYRPDYPEAVVDLLVRDRGLTRDSVIADVGCGTGKLARLFLDRGHRVLGVETNREMREAGERVLARYPRFTAVDGSAESTTLPDGSVDLVVAGQAFHWFEPAATRAEFARILSPAGGLALVWNRRRTGTTPFLADYEAFLRAHGTDYENVARDEIDLSWVRSRLGSESIRRSRFDNHQLLDLDGLRGRLLSCSYVPSSGEAGFEPMLLALRALFDAHQVDGRVRLDYDTEVYHGRLSGRAG